MTWPRRSTGSCSTPSSTVGCASGSDCHPRACSQGSWRSRATRCPSPTNGSVPRDTYPAGWALVRTSAPRPAWSAAPAHARPAAAPDPERPAAGVRPRRLWASLPPAGTAPAVTAALRFQRRRAGPGAVPVRDVAAPDRPRDSTLRDRVGGLRRPRRPRRSACGDRPPLRRVPGRARERRRRARHPRRAAGPGPHRPGADRARQLRRGRGTRVPAGAAPVPVTGCPRRRRPGRREWARRRRAAARRAAGVRDAVASVPARQRDVVGSPDCLAVVGATTTARSSSRTTTTASSASPSGHWNRCRASTSPAGSSTSGPSPRPCFPCCVWVS